MARRLYLGRLPPDTRSEDVEKMFDGYGRVVDCRVMTGFGFVEFESSRDAEDAVQQFNGKSFMGTNIVVEFAKESRPRREPYEDRGFAARARRPPGIRLIVDGISKDTSWQDLKDFGREAGSVSFADIDRDNPGQGILEYLSRDDADHAIKTLDGRDLRGQPVRVTLSEDVSPADPTTNPEAKPTSQRGGPDNFRRDDRFRDGDRYERRSDDRYRGGREAPRRGRSDSPPPRRDDRARSPRREYDDRKGGHDDRRDYDDRRGGYDDRRGGPEPYEKRRDDRRRDDRDGGRYEERSSRHTNGNGY